MIECNWLDDVSSSFNTELSIECMNRSGILSDVIALLPVKKNLIAANARVIKDRTAHIDITVEVESKPQIDLLIKKLHRVPGIYDIKRTIQ